jgi:hypothetical protein
MLFGVCFTSIPSSKRLLLRVFPTLIVVPVGVECNLGYCICPHNLWWSVARRISLVLRVMNILLTYMWEGRWALFCVVQGLANG